MKRDSEKNDELVEVAEAPNPIIAASWQELLAQEGIPAAVKCNDPLAVAYLQSSYLPCTIVVPAHHAAKAREILESLRGEDGCDESEADGDS